MNWQLMHQPVDKPKWTGSPLSWALYVLIALYHIINRHPAQARQDGGRKLAKDERFLDALRQACID